MPNSRNNAAAVVGWVADWPNSAGVSLGAGLGIVVPFQMPPGVELAFVCPLAMRTGGA